MRVAVNGTTLHVVDRGAGSLAVVFLHYFAGSSEAWDPVVSRIQGDFRCVVPDLRGFGDSAAPAGGYTMSGAADDIAALVDQLALGAYAVVGHSMGGKIALALAARRPPGLQALVLVAPSPPTPEPIAEGERMRLLATHGQRQAAEETADRIVAHPLDAALREVVVRDNLRTSHAAWCSWLERGSREDITASAGEIVVPTLVVAGGSDSVLSVALLEHEVVGRVPGARIVVLPTVGHLVPLEEPAALATLVLRELRDTLTPASGTHDALTPEPRGLLRSRA